MQTKKTKQKNLSNNQSAEKKYVSKYKSDLFKNKHIIEPKPICKLCNKVIENISSAIMEEDDYYSHFDCVIHLLNSKYNIMPPDKISYVGQGNFAIMGIKHEGGYYIKQKIQYETQERYKKMKEYVDSNMSY